MKNFISLVLVIVIIALFPQTVKANVIFEDNFDDNNINDWTERRNIQWANPSQKCQYNGSNSSWFSQNGKVGFNISQFACVTELTPSNFSLQDVKNYSYEFDMQFVDSVNMDRNYVLKYKDADNSYSIHFIGTNVYFQKAVNGEAYNLPNNYTSYSFEPNKNYHIKNVIEDKRIKVYIDENLIFDITDEQPYLTDGTVGLQASSGSITNSKVLFDNVVVKNLEDTPPPTFVVPYFSQKDPLWASKEYDHISKYSWAITPSMARYGCATTSMAMIMNAHGLDTMPDGTALTPDTLNTWLKTQDDGYIGEALINWRAATRLSEEIAKIDPDKPKLEYTWKTNSTEDARDLIADNQPVIFRVPGHFVVAHGYENDTFKIHDPLWSDRTTLAQTPYNGQFENMRTFQPSHTDLSYLSLFFKPGITVALKSSEGMRLSDVQEYTEEGINPQDGFGGAQPDIQVVELAKPDTGGYQIEIERAEPGNFEVDLLAYNQEASVSALKLAGVGGIKKIYSIQFTKEVGGTGNFLQVEDITPIPSPTPTPTATPTPTPTVKLATFEDLAEKVYKYYKAKEIKNFAAAVRLETPAILGHVAKSKALKLHFANVFEKQLQDLKSKDITPTAKSTLQKMVDEVQQRYK